jgi:hypothetical protein
MLRRLLDVLLAAAARGWPAERRADLVREWNAELYTLDLEPGLPGPLRAARRLRFAVSLVLARLIEPVGLARRLSDVESTVFHTVALAAAPVVAAVPGLVALGPFVLFPARLTPTRDTLLLLARWVVGAAFGALVGTMLARRLVRRRFGRPLGWPGRVLALVPLLPGMVVVDILTRGSDVASDAGTSFVMVGALALVPLLVSVALVMARGSRRAARAVAVVGAPAVVFVATAIVVWLAPVRPAVAEHSPWWWLPRLNDITLPYDAKTSVPSGLPIEHVLPLLPGVMLTTAALALAYLFRASRPLPRDVVMPAASPAVTPPAPAVVARWWAPTMLAGAVYCLVAWAVTLTYLSRKHRGAGPVARLVLRPDALRRVATVEHPGGPAVDAGHAALHDRRGRAVPVVRGGFPRGAGAAGPCGGGTAGRGRRRRDPGPSARPVHPAVAGRRRAARGDGRVVGRPATGSIQHLLAARPPAGHPGRRPGRIPGPGRLLRQGVPGARSADPTGAAAGDRGGATLLAVLAAVGVVAMTTRRVPGPVWAAPLAAGAVSTVVGVLLWNDALWPTDRESPAATTLRVAGAAFVGTSLPLPWAVLAIGLIRGRPRLPRQPVLVVLACLGLVPVGFVLSYLSIFASMIIGRLLLRPMTYAQTYDGLPFVPGAVLIGLGISIIAAIDLARPVPVAAPTPEHPV